MSLLRAAAAAPGGPQWLWCALVVITAVCGFAVPCAAQNCVLYTEQFDSFAGPANFSDGTFQVQWCASGAAVASNSFCPGGNALRLDSATEDPIVWVGAAGAGCVTVTLEFDYSQFQDTQTILRYAATNDTAMSCTRAIALSAGLLTETGGVCTHAVHTVVIAGGTSVYWKFDHGTNSNAIFIDNVTVKVDGCCYAAEQHSCCELGAAGCADNAIQACVCELDPYCCATEWDEICVDEVESLNCGSCAAVECLESFATDFGTTYQTGTVCARFPDLFERCEGSGPYLTSGTACGGSSDIAMSFATGFPYSAAVTKCIDLTMASSARLQFNYTKNSGTLGPRVDVSTDGEAFATIWTAPIQFAGGCQSMAIDLSAYAGLPFVQFRFASGSSTANGASMDDINVITGDTAQHECCDPGSAGCVDSDVQECVCAIDPFCCEVEWDDLCVLGVEYYQCGDCGFCVEQFGADFGAALVGGTVCDVFPDLFILCDGAGPFLTTGTACGGPNDPALLFISGPVTSAVTTRCLNLAGLTAASIEFNWSPNQHGLGPAVEVSLDAGGTFGELWRAPAGTSAGCYGACVDLSEFAGHPFVLLRFAAAEPSEGGSAIDDILLVRGSACAPSEPDPDPTRPEDVDGDGTVDVNDLFLLLGQWGPCPATPQPCSGDVNGDGAVNVTDLFMLLSAWDG